MKPTKYLEQLVSFNDSYQLTEHDKKVIKYEGIEKFILNSLSSTRFKASAIPKDLLNRIKKSINLSVTQNQPIHITIPFGGYKKWQLPTYPYPDWSEVFVMTYIYNYLQPIAQTYSPGVIIDFWSDEIFISRMNNYPQEDIDLYNKQFNEILTVLNKNTNESIQFTFSRIRDSITQKEILKRFDKTIKKLREEWKELPKETREFRLQKTERNYMADWSEYNNQEKENILLESTLVHDAFIFGDWDKDTPWAFDKHMIPLGFCYTGDWGVHIQSTPTSTNQFWVGIGTLKPYKDSFLPTSLTYEQFKSQNLQKKEINLFDRKYIGLQKIYILE